MLPSFCADAVTVTRPGEQTLRGAVVPDWTNSSPHVVKGCSLQPAATMTRDGEQRINATSTSAVLYAPPGADILAGDRVTFDGQTWSVDGQPLKWRSPTGAVSHLVVNLTAESG